MIRLFLILTFAALSALQMCLLFPGTLHADQQQEAKEETQQGIYVWTDEHGVVHMRDKKPEHLEEGMTRMEQRQRYFQKHPEARNKTQDIVSGKSQLPDHDARTPRDGADQPQTPVIQQGQPGFPDQDFQPQMQISPLQMILASLVPLLVGLLLYVATSYVLYRIGRKFGIGSFAGYLIPIYNVILLCRCAGLTGWFVLFLFVPVINIFVTFLIWGKIAERLGKNLVLWGLLCTILGLPILVLAFDSSMPVDLYKPPRPKQEEEPNVYI